MLEGLRKARGGREAVASAAVVASILLLSFTSCTISDDGVHGSSGATGQSGSETQAGANGDAGTTNSGGDGSNEGGAGAAGQHSQGAVGGDDSEGGTAGTTVGGSTTTSAGAGGDSAEPEPVVCPAGTLGDVDNVCIPVVTVAGGDTFACALRTDGHVQCWGDQTLGLNPAGLENVLFSSLTAGSDFMCGIRDNGLAYCWGASAPIPKSGSYYALTAGRDHVCGIKTDRTLACASERNDDETTAPPTGTYQFVSSGAGYSCALVQGGALAGRATCWGVGTQVINNFPTTAQTQTFKQIYGGGTTGWGVLPAGTTVNWGQTLFSGPSSTVFKTLAGGGSQDRCGVLMDNSITCWGIPNSAATLAPSGKFKAVAMGGGFACAVKASDLSIQCWGDNTLGKAPATVSGTFQGYW
jgi:hypothetical protein